METGDGCAAKLNKLVSVVTPAFNSENTIEKTVRSVSAQSIQVLEHIVIDDGSSDDTVSLLERLRIEIPHLKILRQNNKGAGAARNAGINLAAGRYIAFLDSDDTWLPHKLERQIGFMVRTGAKFTYGDYIAQRSEDESKKQLMIMPETLDYSQFLRSCPIGCLTVAYNQDFYGKVYMSDVRRGQDWSLWLTLTRSGEVAKKYPGVEAVYSLGEDSLSSKKMKKLLDVYRIYTNQEGCGKLSASWFLFRHVLSKFGSWPKIETI